MRSLWSGVSGLRMHQIGMDVEGNNIANVSTNGFKYSRVNYSTMFSQTMAIATRPTGELGGQNAMQIGLGVNANSTYRIHSQGSITRTDSNYDIAINGNGFFLVSDDGGDSKYLTRDGAFNVDAAGNFVNASGYVVQGWVRNPTTGRVDTTVPAGNISWDPAMQLPANPSSQIYLNASLNSGLKIDEATSRVIYSLDSVYNYNTKTGQATDENDSGTTQFYTTSNNEQAVTEKGVDFASLFDGDSYQSLNVRDGQGIWMSFADAEFSTNKTGLNAFDPNLTQSQTAAFWGSTNGNVQPNTVNLDITINGVAIQNNTITSLDQAIQYINTFTAATDTREGTGVRAVKNADGSGIDFINTNANGTTDSMKNINLVVNAANTAGEAHNITYDAATQTFTTTALARTAPVGQTGTPSLWTADGTNVTATINGAGTAGATITFGVGAAYGTDATSNLTLNSVRVITAHKYTYSSSAQNLSPMINPDGGMQYTPGVEQNAGAANYQWPATDQGVASQNYYNAVVNGSLKNSDTRVFHSTEDLRELLQRDARYGVDYDGTGTHGTGDLNEKVKVVVNETGNYVISNPNETTTTPQLTQTAGGVLGGALTADPKNMNFQATEYQDAAGTISKNTAFSNVFQGWEGNLNTGTANKSTKDLALSAFGASLQVFDSLGTEHLISVEWVKQSTTLDGGNEWQMIIKVPEPATINTTGDGPTNIVVGNVRFGNDGSLISYSPRTINFSGNNGSAPNQQISLNLGSSGDFDGLVSNDQTSALQKQQTDGYKPGSLRQGAENIRVDQQGNIIGSFDNGIQLVLARVAMGNVTNDAGLEDMGGNLYRVSANSGDLTIGTSGTGGRGTMQTSALESSNADLSTSLTNLIIIQRAYQANSKTITTSDQLLNTLIQLKQ